MVFFLQWRLFLHVLSVDEIVQVWKDLVFLQPYVLDWEVFSRLLSSASLIFRSLPGSCLSVGFSFMEGGPTVFRLGILQKCQGVLFYLSPSLLLCLWLWKLWPFLVLFSAAAETPVR